MNVLNGQETTYLQVCITGRISLTKKRRISLGQSEKFSPSLLIVNALYNTSASPTYVAIGSRKLNIFEEQLCDCFETRRVSRQDTIHSKSWAHRYCS